MLYHSFSTACEPNAIGVKDGMAQVVIRPEEFANLATYQELEHFFHTYWQRVDHTPPNPFVIEYAKLRPKAKLTDFLDFSPFLMACPFMLSGQAKAVFAQHCIPPSYLFDVFIYDKAGFVTSDYSLFYCPLVGYEAVDFAKSRFRINRTLPFAPDWENLTFPDQKTYKQFVDTSNKFLEVELLVMNETFNSGLDLFYCRLGRMFMSERLKSAVEEAGLTGLLFPVKTGSLAFAD
jgi:hypothetical protein